MKKDIVQEIESFLHQWDQKTHVEFLKSIIPLVDLYDVEKEDDWVKDAVGEENEQNVRLIRTVYLISKFADFHSSKIALMNVRFKKLWKKLEEHVEIHDKK